MRAETSNDSPTSNPHCKHTRTAAVEIPKGLIGAKCTAHILINGQSCSCLLDTGSQVTTVPQSFYESNLSHLKIHPLNELLEVEAANGQTVPYLGFIEVDITFPKSCFGSEISVPTLALVVPNTRSNTLSKLLIGTNTLDLVYENCCNVNTDLQSLPYGYRVVMKVLQKRNRQREDSSIGLVRLPGKEPKVIPAGQSCVVEGQAHVNGQALDRWIVTEQPSSSLPGGLLALNCLLTLTNESLRKLPVVLRNESKHDIIIPAKSVIAEIHALQEVLPSKRSPAKPARTDKLPKSSVKLNLNFDGSPLPADCRKKIEEKAVCNA